MEESAVDGWSHEEVVRMLIEDHRQREEHCRQQEEQHRQQTADTVTHRNDDTANRKLRVNIRGLSWRSIACLAVVHYIPYYP